MPQRYVPLDLGPEPAPSQYVPPDLPVEVEAEVKPEAPEPRRKLQLYLPVGGPLGIGGTSIDVDDIPEPFRSLYTGYVRGSASFVRDLVGTARMLGISPIEPARQQLGEYIKTLPPGRTVEDVAKAGSVFEGVKWLAELFGEQAPNVIGTGLGYMLGGPWGAAGVSFVLNAGETYNNLRDRGVEPKVASVAAGLVGGGKTVLDMVVPIRMIGGVGKLPELKWLPVERVLSSPALRKALASDTLVEGTTEAGQEVLDILAELSLGVNEPSQNLSRMLNAFVGGAVTPKLYSPFLRSPEPRNPISPETTASQPRIEPTTKIAGLKPAVSEAQAVADWNLSSPKKLEVLMDAGLVVQVKPGLYQYSENVTAENGQLQAVVGQSVIVPSRVQDTVFVDGHEMPIEQVGGVGMDIPAQPEPAAKQTKSLTAEEAKKRLNLPPEAKMEPLIAAGLVERTEDGKFDLVAKAKEDGRIEAQTDSGPIIVNPEDNNSVTLPGGRVVSAEEFAAAKEEAGGTAEAVAKLVQPGEAMPAPLAVEEIEQKPEAEPEEEPEEESGIFPEITAGEQPFSVPAWSGELRQPTPVQATIRQAIIEGTRLVYDAKYGMLNGVILSPEERAVAERELQAAIDSGDAEVVGKPKPTKIVTYESKLVPVQGQPVRLAVSQERNFADDNLYAITADVYRGNSYVGTTTFHLDPDTFAGAEIPDRVVVDVGESTRRRDIPRVLNEAVMSGVLQPALNTAKETLARVYAETGATFDSFSQLERADLDPRVKEAIRITGERVAAVFDRIRLILKQSKGYLQPQWASIVDRIEGIGVLFAPDRVGAFLMHPETGNIKIYINPFALEDGTTEELGDVVYATLMHELAHGRVRGETDEFYKAISEALEAFADVEPVIHQLINKELRVSQKKVVRKTEEGEGESYEPEPAELVNEAIYHAATTLEKSVISDTRADPTPGVLHNTRAAGYVRRQIDTIRKGEDPALVAKATERLQDVLIHNPDILKTVLADKELAAWAAATLEGLPVNPDGSVLVFRAAMPGIRTWGTDVYLTQEAAKKAAQKFWQLPHTSLQNLRATVEAKGAGWLRIGNSTYKLVKDDQGSYLLRDRNGYLLMEGTLDYILGEIEKEIGYLKETLAKNAGQVTAYMVPRESLLLRVGNVFFARQTPSLRERIVRNALVPRLRRDTEGIDKKDKLAAAAAAKFKAMTEGWAEYERKSGLDRLGRFFRYSLKLRTLLQLVQRLPGFTPLQDYYKNVEAYWRTKTEVLEKANAILEDWVKLGYADGQVLGKVLLNVTKRSFTERRKLLEEEVKKEITKAKGDPEKLYPLFQRVDEIFRESGRELLKALETEAKKIYKDPEIVRVFLRRYDGLREDVENRNYFPLARFGKFAVVVKENGRVVDFEAFVRQSQAEARIKQLRKEDPTRYVQKILLSDAEAPLLMFPPALFDYLVDHLGLNTEQVNLLREVQQTLSPGNKFSRHYLKRSLVPGEDSDAMAGFADYFQHFSNHLARLRHRYDLETQLRKVDEVSANVMHGYEVGAVRDLLKRHFQDLMNPSNDLAATRAGLFLYMFAFLPSAAAVNLTQVPIYTYPYLAKRLGNDKKAVKHLGSALKKLLQERLKGPVALSDWEREMLERGVKAGVIEESFVSTIAQFANKGVLQSYWEGAPKLGYYFHQLGSAAIWAFHSAEVFNRQVTFLAALETAKALGLRDDEAIFEFAKSAVRNTQFEYAYYNRPEVFRGGKGLAQLKPLIGVFKMFLQGHLYFAFSNQGGWRFWMMLVALSGLKGAVPFSEDILNILNALGTFLKLKLGLKNPKVDLEEAAKKFLAKIGANPDLALYGLSRYGFGLGLTESLFGLPFPSFDLSNMISMQEILPAIKPITQAMLGEIDSKEAMHEAFFRTLGAAFTTGVGAGSSLLDVISGKPGASVRWAPRELQYMLKAYRAARSGYYMSSTGQPLAKIDMRDPVHVAELVAYALGATPTRLSKAIEAGVTAREHVAFYEAWKERIIGEFVLGVLQKDEKLRKDAIMDLRKFQKLAPVEMRFRGTAFQEAVKMRLKNKRLAELGLPPQERYWRLFKEFQHQE